MTNSRMTNNQKQALRDRADALVTRAAMRKPPQERRPAPIREIIHITEPTMKPAIEKKTTYSVPEAATLVGRSAETIRRHCASGNLKAAGGGKGTEWRISRTELADWWKRQGGGRLFPDTDE